MRGYWPALPSPLHMRGYWPALPFPLRMRGYWPAFAPPPGTVVPHAW